jgi:hypothetical protein
MNDMQNSQNQGDGQGGNSQQQSGYYNQQGQGFDPSQNINPASNQGNLGAGSSGQSDPSGQSSSSPVSQSQGQQDDKKVTLTEEEIANFDMREFDQTLKPDLGNLANDSLGKALGTTGDMSGAGMTSAQQYEDIVNTQIASHNLNFDENLFKTLLAGSISLLYNEKKAVLAQVPKLSQNQIDELIKILNEEKRKFAELNKKHKEELKKIEEKYDHSEEKETLHIQEMESKQSDQEKAEELLRKLQGGS